MSGSTAARARDSRWLRAIWRVLSRGALAACLAGCAAVPWPVPGRAPLSGVRDASGYLDLRGIVHVHTSASHDSHGSVDQLLKAARKCGVQWVAVTEHRKGEGDPWERFPVQSDITVIPGWEMRAAGGSILAIGVYERPQKLPTPEAIVSWVHSRGGVAFVGHMEKSRLVDPEPFASADLDGLELTNLHAQARAHTAWFSLAWISLPAPFALRTLLHVPEEHLRIWDRLPGDPGIVAGADSHSKFRVLGRAGGTVDRYADQFRMVTTHVRSRDTSAESIVEALREGRSYIAFEGLAAVDRFEVTRRGGEVHVEAPRRARIRLICDGELAGESDGSRVTLSAPETAELCRVEARLHGRLWIASGRERMGGRDSAEPRARSEVRVPGSAP